MQLRMSTQKALVILFKSPDEDLDIDPYESALQDCGLDAAFVPVLQHGPVSQEQLHDIFLKGPKDRFGGVVFTSSRAAEMWVHAAMSSNDSNVPSGEGAISISTSPWDGISFYVVGKKTARVLSKSFTSSQILGAEESGTGAKLAQFILSDYPSRSRSKNIALAPSSEPTEPASCRSPLSSNELLPLLLLTGDKSAGTLQSTLTEGGPSIELVPLQVYKTWPRSGSDFKKDLSELKLRYSGIHELESQASPHRGTIGEVELNEVPFPPTWLVFFAPSAAKAVLPEAEKQFRLPHPPSATPSPFTTSRSQASSNEPSLPPVRIAAIGPTTEAYLASSSSLSPPQCSHGDQNKEGSELELLALGPNLVVDVVPSKPGPQKLADAISSFMTRIELEDANSSI